MNRRPLIIAAAALGLAALGRGSFAADTGAGGGAAPQRFEQAFEQRVHEHVLKNGLRLLVLERHEVPIVSFVTKVNTGSVDEHVGITGVAHIFEHMAFKGSREIGVTDPEKEREILAKLDALFDKLSAERALGERAKKDVLTSLEAEFDRLEKEAQDLVVNNEFSVIMDENGGHGMNASTASDTTQYFVSFPSNRLELWYYMESQRFKEPILREFWKEKAVVMEERRMRTESSPIGKLLEEFDAVAWKAHPYGYPTVGHASDIASLTRGQAADFFRKHYVPNNITMAIVGDVDAARCDELAERYFGSLPRGPEPEPVSTKEPPQEGEKRVEVESPAQPLVLIGYHRPAASSPDDPVYDVISAILSEGRTSRFYDGLVKKKQVAMDARTFAAYPGDKYPCLFGIMGRPSIGHTADELEKELEAAVERLRSEPVSEAELARVKTEQRASFIRGLNSNHGLAERLTSAQVILGDWREGFRELAHLEAVTAADVQRVAKATFAKKNRTVGKIVKPEASE